MKSDIDRLETLFDGYLRKPVQKKSLLNEVMKFLPFEHNEKKHEVLGSGFSEFPEAIEPAVIPDTVKQLFRNELYYAIVDQSRCMIVNELEALTDKLASFAAKHHIGQLTVKASNLKEFIDSFDFDQIQYCLISINSLFDD